MTVLSSGNLYQPVLVGSDQLRRMDDVMWPTYHRVTLEQGGDHYAEFQISAEDHGVTAAQLERWFFDWIGCHFVESYSGRDVFQGYVHTLRLYVGGVMRQISYDDMYNRVRVWYQAGSAGTKTLTSAADDTALQAKYGYKELFYDTLPNYFYQTHAEAIRDQLLNWHKYPQATSGDVVTTDAGSTVLEVYIQGYVHTLGFRHDHVVSGSASDTTLTGHITTDVLAGHDFVTAGSIATISTTVTTEFEYATILERLTALLKNTDYKWGCFASRSFDIVARDTANIKYRRQAYGDRYGFRQGGRYVPEPLITPGGWLFTEDIFTALPLQSDLRDDPRADWISSVDYSIDGVTLTNPDWATQGLALTLSSEIQETAKEQRQMWIDRAALKTGEK